MPEDPIAAYNRLALAFAAIAKSRERYLRAVEALIAAAIPPASRTLLDIGSGDGTRAHAIARAAKIPRIILLEPSEAMRAGTESLPLRAEQLNQISPPFDVITCLWNVLGHIFPAAARTEVLRQCARLAGPRGRIFIDVNHRYNTAHYGLFPTIPRALNDLLSPSETNGDVTVSWDVEGRPCTTQGHVFTHREFAALCRAAGLVIERRTAVDYKTGAVRRFTHHGHLLYQLRAL